jgi:Ca-activated chloride channel family protein
MTDELETLKQLVKRERPVVPRPAARRRAIAEAVLRFEALNQPPRQGLSLADRLRRAASAASITLFRRRSMQLKLALAGSASLAVLALAVINIALFRTPQIVANAPPPAAPAAEPQISQPVSGGRQKSAIVAQAPAGLPEEERMQAVVDALQSQATKSPARPSVVMDAAVAPPMLAAPSPAPMQMDALSGGVAGYSTAEADMGQGGVDYYQSPNYPPSDDPSRFHRDHGRDRFTDIVANPTKIAADEPVSTFSIDVDTTSYAFVRASLNSNLLPQKDAVRVEELINYFPYDYEGPADRAEPFKATVSAFPTPWNADTRLLHVGIKGFTLDGADARRANLVFLIDTSGSMDEPNKLPLVRNALKLLVETLDADDSVAIVAYAGNAGTVLEPTKAKDKARILAALDGLGAAGSTAGAEGIRQAYQLAEKNFDRNGINRVILATDGDFNVGITDPEELKSFVERKRETGVYLSVLGFGMGNYNDEMMQKLAQNGNGNAAYIDNLNEARKTLVDEAGAMLFPIAKDVKIQVEFNPDTVSEYRLIGYETRLLNREDFNNDKVDAGEIGAGHTVTALYEITPKGAKAEHNDPLRYSNEAAQGGPGSADEYAFLKLRYKLPGSDTSALITMPVTRAAELASGAHASNDVRFATAVAAFGQLLRGGQYTGSFSYDDVITLAQGAKGSDEFGYRAEFINLVRLAKTAQSLEPLPQ